MLCVCASVLCPCINGRTNLGDTLDNLETSSNRMRSTTIDPSWGRVSNRIVGWQSIKRYMDEDTKQSNEPKSIDRVM